VNFSWVVSQEVLLSISWRTILRVGAFVLAILPEEMANNNCKCNPNYKDLEHQPKIDFRRCGHALVPLSLKINELHKQENSHLKK
jgi:hypothetical protein